MARKAAYGRTRSGVELTDHVLAAMAAQAEAGLDLAKLRRRPSRRSPEAACVETLSVQLEPDLRAALDERAAAEGTTASDVVRAALRAYLLAR